MNSIIKNASLNAIATALYIGAVASFMFYVPDTIGPVHSVLIPITMLLLFVFSATFTGMLVLGRPILWYLDGKKQEAISLLVITLLILLSITLIALFILVTL